MLRISDELVSLIKKQLEDHGIVVWYDPERHYTKLVEKLEIPETTILRYEGSFFELRYKMEPFLEFVDEKGNISDNPDIPPKLLIYVPLRCEDTEYALAEAEAYGVVMGPGISPWQRNTRLRVLAERIFKKVAPQEVKNILDKVDRGVFSLEDLDRLVEREEHFDTLRLIFDTSNPQEIILRFLSSQDFDSKILEKQALTDLGTLVKNTYGFEVDHNVSIGKFKQDLSRSLLMAEFVLKLKASCGIPETLAAVFLPEDHKYQKAILSTCNVWRNRFDLRGSYAKYAEEIARAIPFDSLGIRGKDLQEIETFAPVEELLLDFAEDEVIRGNYQGVKELVQKRKNSFWASFREEFQFRWLLLESAASLLYTAEAIRKEVSHLKKIPSELLKAYTSGEKSSGPWYMLDRLQRILEYRYARFCLELSMVYTQLDRIISIARRKYAEVATVCADALIEAIKEGGKDRGPEEGALLRQRDIFRKRLFPLVSEGRVAYVLVDALRYEMGLELAERFKDEFEVEVEAAFCELPTITQVGMAALMPGAENGIEPIEIGRGEIGVRVGNAVLKDRSSRLKYLASSLDKSVVFLKLDELVRAGGELKELKTAQVIVVTSQEIDRRGEEIRDESEARIYMEEVSFKLKRGIGVLVGCGVSQILLTADHGFVFLDKVDESMKVDPPRGETVDLHSRVWIGKGGTSSPFYELFKAKEIGLKGEFEFAFPRGLACFRVRGKESSFFHGGISLPEMVIPVIRLSPLKSYFLSSPKTSQIKLEFPQKRITNRFFTVRLVYIPMGIFKTEKQKVQVVLTYRKEVVGGAVTSSYGFDEGSREITLEKQKENIVTMILEREVKRVDIRVLDVNTGVELVSLKDIEVNLAI